MGCGRSKPERNDPPGGGPKEFAALAAETPFSVDEVESLFELFKKLSNSVVQDGYIQKEELQYALFRNTTKRSLFLDRMFDLFDLQKNGHIEFGEFVRSLSIFHPNTSESVKIKHAFRLYDLRGTGFIEREELKDMVSAILLESDLHLSEEVIGTIVDQTFVDADLNGDGKIDLEEWRDYVAKNPKLLKNMTLPYLMDTNLSFPSFKLNKEAEAELLPSPAARQQN